MFADFIIKKHRTGSNYVCDPPVTNTDKDVVILSKPGYESALEAEGWSSSMSDIEYDTQGDFVSWKKGDLNYIVTTHPLFYKKFVYATMIAKLLNLKQKSERIKLFQAVLYNVWQV